MPEQQRTYRAYLLRLWLTRTEASGATGWCASLEDPHTNERLGFATLDHLFAYLLAVSEGGTSSRPTSGAEDEVLPNSS